MSLVFCVYSIPLERDFHFIKNQNLHNSAEKINRIWNLLPLLFPQKAREGKPYGGSEILFLLSEVWTESHHK